MGSLLLSICIPTYNRANMLRQALDSILPQIAKRDDVELVILDNASSDSTPAVVSEYMLQYAHLRYIRQSENVGFDRNIISCVEQARGEYISLFGDDDIALPGAFERILREIADNKPTIIRLNCYPFRGSDYRRQWGPEGPRQDIVFQIGKELAFFAGFGFISVLTFRADYARQFTSKVSVGWGAAHVEIVERIALSKAGPFVYLGTQSIAARTPAEPSTDGMVTATIGGGIHVSSLQAEGLLEPKDARHILSNLVRGPLWRGLLRKKCLGDEQQLLSQKPLLYKYFGGHPLFRLYAFLIFLVPKPFLCVLYHVTTSVNGALKRLRWKREIGRMG